MSLRRLRLRALACIREGRVRILVADRRWDAEFREWMPSLRILAQCASTRRPTPYEVRLVDGVWSCTCGDRTAESCKHRTAVALVTGHAQPGTAVGGGQE